MDLHSAKEASIPITETQLAHIIPLSIGQYKSPSEESLVAQKWASPYASINHESVRKILFENVHE